MLTSIGSEVAERARRILAEVRDLTDSAQGVSPPLAGDLRLGVIPTVGPYLLPKVLPSLRRTYPELRLYLREDQTERLVERLKSGDLDTLLLAMPVSEPSFEAEPLFDENFVVAVPAGHRLAARNQVSESDLRDEQVLLLEEGHCFRDQALAVCGHRRARDRDSFAATSLDTLREMVASRIGVTLLPALSVTGVSLPGGAVEIRPFAPPSPSRRVALVWRREAARGREFKVLAEFLRDNLPVGAEAVR
jgi:LysR family hydrogen peroxide-inducible transcriptional activator